MINITRLIELLEAGLGSDKGQWDVQREATYDAIQILIEALTELDSETTDD